jgi:geranylgeranyl pyrophosphate synthase
MDSQTESMFFEAATQVATRLADCSPAAQERLESFGRMLGETCGRTDDSVDGPVLKGTLRRNAERALAALPESKAKRELLTLDWSSFSAA